MTIKIALAGNPNSGKTTLFNALTGSNQFVGNWPGVTVEKKEGRLKKDKDVIVVDLPGIYSLSPYSLEEVIARNFLVSERPDVIINIVDGTNIERNLYLTTQLTEIGIPVVVAINLMDVVEKAGDKINVSALSKQLGCKVVGISALKGTGVEEVAKAAIDAAKSSTKPVHRFSDEVEQSLAGIQEVLPLPEGQERFFAVKLFERDKKAIESLQVNREQLSKIEAYIQKCEKNMDDDAESIIINERYSYITSIIDSCYTKNNKGKLSTTDKIDRVVTNKWLALPIFAMVMFLVYFISVTTVGSYATDWANDGLFGDGWFLFGKGSASYEEAVGEYNRSAAILEAFETAAEEAGIEPAEATGLVAYAEIYDEEGNWEETVTVNYDTYSQIGKIEEPDPTEYGTRVPGVPVLVGNFLEKVRTAEWLQSLILDGIIAGVGAVLGFVPQMLVLFLLLAFLESCGYMARIAFILDRVFKKFGLSGKSFIPILVGTGCGVPGIMASRTIESDRDRKMTIITTTFIPCGAKLPIIALIAGAMFNGAWWVAPSAYFVGIAAIILSGIVLKKTKLFAGDPSPFVMELPAYRLPTVSNLLRSTWERGRSFIKKAGTVILTATVFVWVLSNFGFDENGFGQVEMDKSLLAAFGNLLAPLFAPLGWGHWQGAVATLTGLIAKENVVGTLGVLFGGYKEVAANGRQVWVHMRDIFTPLAAYSYLVFNLLCAPCFAAIGAIKREMNNGKWTIFAITYQCTFAYAVSFMIYNIGSFISTGVFGLGTAIAFTVLAVFLYLLIRPQTTSRKAVQKAVANA
jgi:ferrous iron transport protein B